MKLEIHEIYHQYICRLVIFSVFLFKRQIRQPNVYKLSIDAYLRKRLPWDINLKIDMGIKLDKEDEREILLEELLNGIESDFLSNIEITFNTPHKHMIININLKDEKKYENFLYL